jgi:hypothetical protein
MALENDTGIFVVADRLRYSQHEILIGESDGDDASIASNDNVRIKIGREGQTPLLEVESDAATANGSRCTAANPTVLSLAAADLAFQAGLYDIEALVVDTSDSDRPKKAEQGIFHLRETLAGDVD